MKTIGFSEETIKMLMNYLKERKQYVQLNTNKSDILLTGEKSVSQGSIVSGLFYIMYTLDMHQQSHILKHKSHREYLECKNPSINVYVDDCFGIIKTENRNIWKLIDKYIRRLNDYYINNKLQMNVKKQML